MTILSRGGCDCPPWILRCLHYEGLVLTLRDYGHSAYIAMDDSVEECRYEIFGGWSFGPFVQDYWGDDRVAALAAFAVAEQRLLGLARG